VKSIGIIPARGNSKELPRKNMAVLCGKRLLHWTVEQAIKSSLDKVIVSSEDHNILRFAGSVGADVIERDEKLSSDHTHSIEVVIDVLNRLTESYDIVSMLLPTSPFRRSSHIDASINMVKYGYDSVIGICKRDKPLECIREITESGHLLQVFGMFPNVQRNECRASYETNGAIFTALTDVILTYRTFHVASAVGYVMDKVHSIDINSKEDLAIAEAYCSAGLIGD